MSQRTTSTDQPASKARQTGLVCVSSWPGWAADLRSIGDIPIGAAEKRPLCADPRLAPICRSVTGGADRQAGCALACLIFRFLRRHRLSAFESRQAAGLGPVVASDPGDVVTIADVQPPQLASVGAALGAPARDKREVGL